MNHQQNPQKRRMNKSARHFNFTKKLSTSSIAVASPSPLFKASGNSQSASNFMRRSQGAQTRTRYREDFYKTADQKKANEYGLHKNNQTKKELQKPVSRKNMAFKPIQSFARAENQSYVLEEEQQKNKMPFRRNRIMRRSPLRRQKNMMKESCSTESTHRHNQSPTQQELTHLARIIQSLQKSTSQYKNLYEKSKVRLESAAKQAQMEKVKCERIKNIYRQRINQLVMNRQSSKPNFGHLFTYQEFPKDFIPNQIIVENSMDGSVSDITQNFQLESSSKISNLSLDSH